MAFWREQTVRKGKRIAPRYVVGNVLGHDRGDNIWISSGGNCISVAKEQLRKAYGTELWIPEDEDIRELTKASENKEGKYYDEKDEAADEPQMDVEDEKAMPMAAYNKVEEEEDAADKQGDVEKGHRRCPRLKARSERK